MTARFPPAGLVSLVVALLAAFLAAGRAEPIPIVQARNPQESPVGTAVEIEGTVTYGFLGSPDFFVQDESGGIYVITGPQIQLRVRPGTKVRVRGHSAPGEFGTTLGAQSVEESGPADFPAARPTTYEQLATGREDCRRVIIRGVVRTAAVLADDWHGRNLALTVSAPDGNEFTVRTPDVDGRPIESWVESEISVRGVAGGIFNRTRQLTGFVVYAPSLTDITIDKAAPRDPFAAAALVPIRSLLRRGPGRESTSRVKIEGVVLFSSGQRVFIKDSTGAIEIAVHAEQQLAPGDQVEVIGFPAVVGVSPRINGGLIRRVRQGWPIQGKPAVATLISGDRLNGELVTLRARLIERSGEGTEQTLTLDSEGISFQAVLASESRKLPDYPRRSVVSVTGIAVLAAVKEEETPRPFTLLLRDPDDVQLLERPSWWTLGRTLLVATAVAALVLLVSGWAALVVRKNAVLNGHIRERQRAEDELQKAKDELERRVEERTAQLYEEISGRQKAEAEFSIVLKERERIAQELHDSLEQGLVGIGLQLDSAAQAFVTDPTLAARHLALAANMVRYSQSETRRSVWDLRSQSLEDGDLVSALEHVCQQLTARSGVEVRLERVGGTRHLPVLTENNMFRIAQEAITNALKHAQPTSIVIEVLFDPRVVRLRVVDDGHGFDVDGHLPSEGHFGLQGIRERAKRVGGALRITSESGVGTTVEIQVVAPAGVAPSTDGEPHHSAVAVVSP